MLDVAYATTDSPLGPLLLASTDQGLVRVAYLDFADRDDGAAVARRPRVAADARGAAAGSTSRGVSSTNTSAAAAASSTCALDRRLMTDFTRRILTATAAIPFGSVSTYGAVARDAGSPRGSRAAGNALGSNPMPIVIPCHRVLHADGGIGGYTGGLERKRTLLELERAPGLRSPPVCAIAQPQTTRSGHAVR